MERLIGVVCCSLAFAGSSIAQMHWANIPSATVPPHRTDHGMVYDFWRQRVVVFGGLQTSPFGQLGDTWEWDGSDWQLAATQGPPKRSSFGMAFDGSLCHAIIQGGWNQAASGGGNVAYYSDTWLWDGISWLQYPGPGPGPRHAHVMAHDPLRDRVVLFGGLFGSVRSDVWEWDGTSWQQVLASSPTGPRVNATLTFVPMLGELVLIGGDPNHPPNHDDMWSWNGVRWQFVGTSPAVTKHAACWQPSRQRLVLRGGWSPTPSNATYEWDGQNWFTVENSVPYSGHEIVFDEVRAEAVQFGGLWVGVGSQSTFARFTPTVAASTQSEGSGCAVGPVPSLSTSRPAIVGDSQFGFDVHASSGVGAPIVLSLAAQRSWSQWFGGCEIVPDLAVQQPLVALTSAAGDAFLALPLPSSSALAGLQFYGQALVVDGAGPLLGLGSLSNGLRVTIGN